MAGPIATAIYTVLHAVGVSTATAVTVAVHATPFVMAAAKLAATAALSQIGKSKLNTGTSLDFQADLNAGVPLAMGRTAVGAMLAHQYPYGKKNRMLSLFCLLSLGPIQSIDSFKGDEQLATFSTAGVCTNNPSWKDQMFMTTRLGACPDTALPQPGGQATADGTFSQWTSAHKLSGLASAWWVCQFDSDKLNSLPQPQWVIKGVKCYDPRKDSTYPGGSGSHRLTNTATHEFTENPGILALQWVLGYWQNGKKVAGVGTPVEGVDVAAFVTAANVADANGWKAGGRVTTADSKWQVLKSILQAGGAEPCMLGARISCLVSAPKTSLATLNTGDLAGAPRVQAMISRRERKNTLTPRYRSEAHKWEMVAAAPVSNPTYVSEDGATLSDGLDLPLVQVASQAGQLTAYAIVNAREFQPIVLPVKPRWMGYQPGDCITVNIPEIGLNGQKCVILRRTRLDPQTGIVTLTLRSETDAKHAYALGTSAVAPPSPGLTVPDFSTVDAPAAGQWTPTATAQAGGGASVPCITLTGSASDYPFASSIIVEYKLHSDSTWLMWGSSPASSTSITIAGLGGSLSYDVAVSYKSVYGVTGPRTVLGPVTTLAGYGVASTILNQGSLATANNVTYGDGTIKETSGGTTATLLNFKTPLGTAAAITGQGAFATVNSAAYGSSLLTGFAALAAQANLYFGSSLLLESSGGAAATLANFKTALGVASAIAGQGSLATLSSLAYGSTYLTGFGQLAKLNWVRTSLTGTSSDSVGLYSDAYGWLADGQIFTSIGTAAAITGQGAFATFNQVSLNTTYIKMADGTTIMTESLVKTSIGVAAAITGQGSLATKNTADTSDIAPGAATNSNAVSYDAAATINTSSTPEVASVTLPNAVTAGSNVRITADLWLDPNHGSFFYVDVYRGGTFLKRIDRLQCLTTRGSWNLHWLAKNEPAGAQTYSLRMYVASGSDTSVGFVYRYIEATELKR